VRIGAILRITPLDGEAWDVAVGKAGWARTPNPHAIAVLSDGHGLVLDVVERTVLVDVEPVVRITEDELHDLVYLVGFSAISAVGHDGIAWSTGRLALDDLKVVRIEPERIVCSGSFGEPLPSEVVVDPRDGTRISGPDLPF